MYVCVYIYIYIYMLNKMHFLSISEMSVVELIVKPVYGHSHVSKLGQAELLGELSATIRKNRYVFE